MKGWLYLIRNRDLYKIGITKNFKSRMRQLKPDNIVVKVYSRNFIKLERELHKRYKKYRIPQTEYFRLKNYHLKEIKQRLSIPDYTLILNLDLFLKSSLFISCIFLFILLFIYLTINDINSLFLKSFLWMEKISFGFSLLFIFSQSGKYLSFSNELRYRFFKLIIFIAFGLFFRIVHFFLT